MIFLGAITACRQTRLAAVAILLSTSGSCANGTVNTHTDLSFSSGTFLYFPASCSSRWASVRGNLNILSPFIFLSPWTSCAGWELLTCGESLRVTNWKGLGPQTAFCSLVLEVSCCSVRAVKMVVI
jgi:hypothetical protein